MLKLADYSIYTGIAKDVLKRLKTHIRGKGSKYVKSRLPLKLMYMSEPMDKSKALKEEYRIKQLSHKHKLEIIRETKQYGQEIKRILRVLD